MTAEPNFNVVHREIISAGIRFVIKNRQSDYMHSFGYMESSSDQMPRSGHCRRNPVLPIVGRCRLYRTRRLFPDSIHGPLILNKKTHFRTSKVMPGLQHIRHISGEREIHLMANIEPGHIKSIITPFTIYL